VHRRHRSSPAAVRNNMPGRSSCSSRSTSGASTRMARRRCAKGRPPFKRLQARRAKQNASAPLIMIPPSSHLISSQPIHVPNTSGVESPERIRSSLLSDPTLSPPIHLPDTAGATSNENASGVLRRKGELYELRLPLDASQMPDVILYVKRHGKVSSRTPHHTVWAIAPTHAVAGEACICICGATPSLVGPTL
jgi:hypothetical protein